MTSGTGKIDASSCPGSQPSRGDRQKWGRDVARHRVERIAVGGVALAAVVGTVAMTGQMVIDLIVGFRAGARSEMSDISRSIRELPGFEAFFYGAVPALGLAGVAVLAVFSAARRQMPFRVAGVFFVGALLIGSGITALMIIGGLTSCVVLPAMVRRDRTAPAAAAGRVAVVS